MPPKNQNNNTEGTYLEATPTLPYQGLLTGGAAIAGGVADLIGSKNRIGEQQGLYDEAMRLRGLTRGKQDDFKFGIAQAQRDLATAGIRPTDLSPMQGVQATELAALSSDPRALMGGIGASTARANQAIQATQQADLARELGAMQGLANLEQQVLSQNQAKDFRLLDQDSQEQFADATMAAQNKMQLEQDKRNAFGNIAGGVLEAGVSAFTGAKNGGRVKYEEGGKMSEDVMMRILEEQRPVQKTEGEFNHDTNKKAIIDEETGVKEGEATGGEYILNPEQGEAIKMQYDEIARMIEEGGEPSMEELQNLYDAVHEVFSQPQFNEA
tara:strand:- start:1176 stop:2153 length:978 start_codon:yes stop_codon:yes gene_type:complete